MSNAPHPCGSGDQPEAERRCWPPARRTLLIALGTTGVVTAVAQLAPDAYANTAVGFAFLGATWWLVLRGDAAVIRRYGLSLGGLTEPVALDLRRLLGDAGRALGWALLLAAVSFPPFWLGYRLFWHVEAPFVLTLPPDLPDRVLGQLLVVALPEEAFFRGYLQSALDGAWAERPATAPAPGAASAPRGLWRVLGADLGPGWLASAAIFAVGHFLTIPHPNRLAVFFPALAFGWLRARTRGIGAGMIFHALCNLLTSFLAVGFGLVDGWK